MSRRSSLVRTTLGGLHEALVTSGPQVSVEVGKLVEALRDHGVPRTTPAVAFSVPGRIEVLGKHTDYAGGASLVAATRQGLLGVAVPSAERTFRLFDVGRGLAAKVPLEGLARSPKRHWSDYFAVVANRLPEVAPPGRGVTLAFTNTLPRAAGLSSSSVLVVAAHLALTSLSGRAGGPAGGELDAYVTAEYLGAVEAGRPFGGDEGASGVGTRGGSEDHTAILCSEAGKLGLYSYAPIRRLANLPMPDGHVFAIAACGVVAAKTGNARERYNRAADLAASAAEIWRHASGRDDPHLAAAVAGAPGGAAEVRDALESTPDSLFPTSDLLRRFDHFALESRLVSSAATALSRGDLEELGRIVDRSQAGAEELLENQVPETSALATAARELGAAAASAFGAGFGGSVWALLPADDARPFLVEWRRAYLDRFPGRRTAATFMVTDAGPAARYLD